MCSQLAYCVYNPCGHKKNGLDVDVLIGVHVDPHRQADDDIYVT